jgi:cytochrome o ubiquinol oxidase subunit IV
MKSLAAQTTNAKPEAAIGSYATYITGYLLSIILTLTAYFIVKRHVDSAQLIYTHRYLLLALAWLAIAQLMVQLVAFLHLGRGSRARWNLTVFGFMLIVVIIVAAGSLWIMSNLNYRMTPQQMNQYMVSQESGGL